MVTTGTWVAAAPTAPYTQTAPAMNRSEPPMMDALPAPAHPAGPVSLRGCPLSDLRDKLRRVGLRPTRQRVSLGWLLFGKGDRHLSAEMLFDEASRARVPVSLATVYNTLHQFTEAGLLRQLAIDGAKAYFDTNPTEHHHFFIEGEDIVVDVPGDAVAVGQLPTPPEGMEIASVEVIIRLRRKAA